MCLDASNESGTHSLTGNSPNNMSHFKVEEWYEIDGLVQDCSNSIANTLELL